MRRWLATLLIALQPAVLCANPIEAVSGAGMRLDPARPAVAVFDVHGVLLQPTWKQEYGLAYQSLIPQADAQQAQTWVEGNTIHASSEEIVRRMAQASGATHEEASLRLTQAREIGKGTSLTQAQPGALDFIKALSEKKVPVVVMSGSSRAAILAQLRKAGFLHYIPEELIVGSDQIEASSLPPGETKRDAALRAVARHFPGYDLLHFNDWTGGYKGVAAAGGLNFGLPQGEGAEKEHNAAHLRSHGADYLIHGGLSAAPQFMGDLKLSREKQESAAEASLATEDGTAKELALILPAARPHNIPLHIGVSADLTELSYSRVLADEAARKVDAPPIPARIETVARFASSYLISPVRTIAHLLPESVRDAILALRTPEKRFTEFRGVTTSWDGSVDRKAWGTNIDTVFLDRNIQDSGLLKKIAPKKAAEIGVGGGHLASSLVHRLPGLTHFAITDISLYALRAATRNVRAYLSSTTRLSAHLGKGIQSLPSDLDLIAVNPPYIPNWPEEPGVDNDPYRGTGLIRELIREGRQKLNPANPEASLIISMSSMTESDFRKYLAETPGLWRVEEVGQPLEVPLKIGAVSEGWMNWLVSEGGLHRLPHPRADQEPYWHTLRVYRLTPLP